MDGLVSQADRLQIGQQAIAELPMLTLVGVRGTYIQANFKETDLANMEVGQPAEITVLIKAGTLKYFKDLPRYYESSASGKRGFCGECGSRIVWQASDPKEDWLTNICVGSLDNPSAARIACHIYSDTQLPWYRLCDELPKFAENDFAAMMAFLKLD